MRDDGMEPAEIGRLIERERAAGGAGERPQFAVWEENWPLLELFRACRSQWRVAMGFAGAAWLGFDYAGVDIVIRRRRMKRANEAFATLQVMEFAALEVLRRGGGARDG